MLTLLDNRSECQISKLKFQVEKLDFWNWNFQVGSLNIFKLKLSLYDNWNKNQISFIAFAISIMEIFLINASMITEIHSTINGSAQLLFRETM